MTNINDFKVQDLEPALHYERMDFSDFGEEELTQPYDRKNKAYGNSVVQTCQRLLIIGAVTRIIDKCNLLVSLATNPDIDDLGESIDDTLRYLAAFCITLIERQPKTPQQ